jgi:hypothetical protein
MITTGEPAVEICGKRSVSSESSGCQGLSACSACAGDYEDPDCTAPGDEDGWEREDEDAMRRVAEDFLPSSETRRE